MRCRSVLSGARFRRAQPVNPSLPPLPQLQQGAATLWLVEYQKDRFIDPAVGLQSLHGAWPEITINNHVVELSKQACCSSFYSRIGVCAARCRRA